LQPIAADREPMRDGMGISLQMNSDKAGHSLAARISKAKLHGGDKPKAVGVMEAAAILRVGKETIRKLVQEKKLHAFKIGRVLRITVSSIDGFISESRRANDEG
jgi:excisionase family DNA binding protein